jgi:hypothetical protein
MKSRPWLILCVGMLIGILLSGCGFVVFNIARGFASWGALQYETDVKVRSHVKNAGIALPAEAHDIHYGLAGFVDHCMWIRFTVPKDMIWDVVTASVSKSEADFSHSMPENLLSEVFQSPDQEHNLDWWNPSSVTSPRSWSRSKETNGQHIFEDWLIDVQTGTFYISRGDT